MTPYYEDDAVTIYHGDVLDVLAAHLQVEASFDAPAETWLERTPLMQRLVELEQGVPVLTRARWAAKNKAYEIAHGYKKVRTDK